MPEKLRTHPITIIFNFGRVFYLAAIPLIRGLGAALEGGLTGWLSGAWMDILVFCVMLGAAILKWLTAYYSYDKTLLRVSSGLLRRRKTVIPWDRVITASVTKPFYLRPFRAVRFRADTLGGSFKSADFAILLSPQRAKRLISAREEFSAPPDYGYRPSVGSVAALAVLSSNSLGGVAFIAAFISQGGKLLGDWFSHAVISAFEDVSRGFAFGLPPAAAAAAYILLAGWFIGFLLLFSRYKDFTLLRRDGVLTVSGGVFTKREYNIRSGDICFADVRQSVATKLLRLSSLYISAVGYGKHKDDISCLIPTENQKRFQKSLQAVLPSFIPAPRQIKPGKAGIMRFIGQPVFTLCAAGAAGWLLVRIFPEWERFVLFTLLMSAAAGFWFLSVRVIDFCTGGAAFDGENYTLRYSSGFFLHTVVIPREKMVFAELRQSLFQRRGPYCDAIISSQAEGKSIHRCRGLIKEEVLVLFKI